MENLCDNCAHKTYCTCVSEGETETDENGLVSYCDMFDEND